MEPAEPSTLRLPAAQRRETITAAAGRLFGERGYAATRLADIAAAAGVTKPVVYRHFDSKKDLYLALLRKHEEDLPRFFEQAGTGTGTPRELVRAILEVWLDYVSENHHAWSMLFRDHTGDDEIRACRSEVSARAREVMGAFLAEQGGSAIPEREIEPTAELLTSGLAGLALWWIDRPEVSKSIPLEAAARLAGAAVEG